MYVTSDDVPVVYNITGHGEKEYGMVTSMIRQAHYEVEDLQLLTSDIPEDADMLLIFSPQNDFSAEEIEKLDVYKRQTMYSFRRRTRRIWKRFQRVFWRA